MLLKDLKGKRQKENEKEQFSANGIGLNHFLL
jgi:hypothetical protein